MLPPAVRASIGHASFRWINAVWVVVDRDCDTRTVGEWGRVCGASLGALRSICVMQNVRPKPSLTFARVLRVVARQELRHIRDTLEVDDPRTLRTILAASGLADDDRRRPRSMGVDEFLRAQRIITEPACCEAVRLAVKMGGVARDAVRE